MRTLVQLKESKANSDSEQNINFQRISLNKYDQ